MISDEATPLVVDLASSFASLLKQSDRNWHTGYLRLAVWDGVAESKASLENSDGVEIIDVLQHKPFFHEASDRAKLLLAALGKSEGVVLLRLESGLNYQIVFDYEDRTRWAITKLAGGTGIPMGLKN